MEFVQSCKNVYAKEKPIFDNCLEQALTRTKQPKVILFLSLVSLGVITYSLILLTNNPSKFSITDTVAALGVAPFLTVYFMFYFGSPKITEDIYHKFAEDYQLEIITGEPNLDHSMILDLPEDSKKRNSSSSRKNCGCER